MFWMSFVKGVECVIGSKGWENAIQEALLCSQFL